MSINRGANLLEEMPDKLQPVDWIGISQVEGQYLKPRDQHGEFGIFLSGMWGAEIKLEEQAGASS